MLGWVSDSAGHRETAPVIRMRRVGTETRMITVITTTPVGSSVSAAARTAATGWAVDLDVAGTSRTLGIAVDGSMRIGEYEPAGDVVPVSPARVFESRSVAGSGTVDGLSAGGGRVGAGSTTEIQVTERGEVPGGAVAAMLNVTAVLPSAAGFITVYDCASEVPIASNVNYVAGQVVPNSVLAKLTDSGKICVYSLAETDLVVDVNGYVPADASPVPVSPARVFESRSVAGSGTVDGLSAGGGRVGAGSTTEIQVTERGEVPGGAVAAMLNVTAVLPSAAGFITVYDCASEVPIASNVNYVAGQVVPNSVLAKLTDSGKICVYSLAETDLVVDVNGYVPADASPVPVSPARVFESRSVAGSGTVDGLSAGGGRVGAGSTTEIQVTERGEVPGGAVAAMLNVTAVLPSAAGFITVYDCASEVPIASNVNYVAGQVVPNSVLAKLTDSGKICVYSLAETDLVVDVNGYVD